MNLHETPYILRIVMLGMMALILPLRAFSDEINGQNYRLLVPNRYASYVEPLKKFLDKSERSYTNFFEGIGLRRQRVTLLHVRAFASQAEFKAARKNVGFSSGFIPAAFYSSGDHTAYLYDQADLRITLSNLLHEISHHYIRDFIPDGKVLSTCLNEGLAESVDSSPLQATGISINPDLHLGWGKMVSQSTQANQLLALDRLLVMSLRDFQSLSARSNSFPYAQCWAFCRFLLTQEQGNWRNILADLLIKSEVKKTPREIIRQALPSHVTLDQFEQRWLQFAANPQ